MKWMLALMVGALNVALAADKEPLTVVRGALEQGGFVVGKVAVGAKVTLDGAPVWVGKDGEVVFGFDRLAKELVEVKVCAAGGCERQELHVVPRVYVTQNVTKIPQNRVEPNPAEERQIAADSAATAAARGKALQEIAAIRAFDTRFVLPIEAPTSGVYGSRRTYNGQERSWHRGHDLAAPTGTPVHAPADGIVRLARNTFMSGNLIMLDHGGGVTTVYAHLSKMNVKVGERVKRGAVIGKVGTTGRSSGPHLHWGIYWKNTVLDPILWVAKE